MDTFLQAHTLREGIFSLGDRAPISIRDQIVRAHLLIDSLFRTSVLRKDSKLLVAGAGIAGASAAVLAARRGAQVLLVDPQDVPFSVQSSCSSRWIDPVQYDWPREHSHRQQWPTTGPTPQVPFGFKANDAATLASRWRDELDFESARIDVQLRVWNSARLKDVPVRAGNVLQATIDVTHPALVVTDDFDVVIFARGAKNEKTFLPWAPPNNGAARLPGTFEGLKFWDSDFFEKTHLGLHQHRKGEVYVSGAGDGALQDYIRLVTGKKSALEVLDYILDATGNQQRWGESLLRALTPREEHAHRSMLACSDRHRSHTILSELHDYYIEILEKWRLRKPIENQKVMNALKTLTANRHPERVHLIHECTHFGDCLALNRFVALVLTRFITETHGNPVMSGASLRTTRPYHPQTAKVHTCGPGCWDEMHQIFVESGVTCFTPPPNNILQPYDAYGIVVRHGIEPYSKSRIPRDSLPLHLLKF